MWETAVVGGLIGIMFIWTYLSFNIGNREDGVGVRDHVGIRMLLILMTFLSVFVTLWVIKLIADLNDSGVASIIDVVFRGYGYVFMFIVFYYIITYIIYVINLLKIKR
jgi:hypothetical protein|tara:strand:- start:1067 stop:1390 length:324 start_codon:yes stop_codon:yes gene_type:complete